MLTHMLAHPYAIAGFSYAGIWAFYGLTQGLRESKSPQNHFFFVKRSLRGLFLQQSMSVRHSSFVESEDEDVEEEDVEDEPEPSAFNVACCGRRFRACFSGLTGPFGPWGDVSGPWGNCSDKAGGPYAFLTHTLRVPYAKKHILFSKLVSWQQ